MNIAEMIKNLENNAPNPTDLPTKEEPAVKEPALSVVENQQEEEKIMTSVGEIQLISLVEWMDKYYRLFNNVKRHSVQIRGVNLNETVVISYVVPGEELVDGEPKRTMHLLQNANVLPICDLEPTGDIRILGNDCFEILCPFKDNIFVKYYGLKTSSASVSCLNVDGVLVPYHQTKISKKMTKYEVFSPQTDIAAILNSNYNMEKVQILYKQIHKYVKNMSTLKDVVNWCNEKQSKVFDTNHLLQIDGLIINLLNLEGGGN